MKAKILKLVLRNCDIYREDLQNVYKNFNTVAVLSSTTITYHYKDNYTICVERDSEHMLHVVSKFQRVNNFRELPKWFFELHVKKVIYK